MGGNYTTLQQSMATPSGNATLADRIRIECLNRTNGFWSDNLTEKMAFYDGIANIAGQQVGFKAMFCGCRYDLTHQKTVRHESMRSEVVVSIPAYAVHDLPQDAEKTLEAHFNAPLQATPVPTPRPGSNRYSNAAGS